MLTAKQITFEYASKEVLESTSLSISAGDKIGLVGPNGAGKSTLLRILAGELQPLKGSVVHSTELNVGYLPQEINGYSELTGQEFVEQATGVYQALQEFDSAAAAYGRDSTPEVVTRYELAYGRVEALGAYTLDSRVAKALNRVKLDHAILSKKVGEMSGGQKTKLALAAILLAKFDVFLLDEPTNNLDLDGLAVLESFVSRSSAAFVVVSHDRHFLRVATNKIAELGVNKQIRVYTLGYDEYVDAKRRDMESIRQRYDHYKEEKKRLADASREKRQAAQSASANSRASDSEKVGRNARKEKAVVSHARAAASLSTRLEQLSEPEKPMAEFNLNFRFDTTSFKQSPIALELCDGVVSFGEHQLGPYSLSVDSGDKVVVLGSNGSGKSVLLKVIAGQLSLSSGSLTIGGGIKVGYSDQDYSFASDSVPILDQLRAATDLDLSDALRVLARFGIPQDKFNAPPAELSPGQRARVKLGSLVSQGANLLLLDEPTNHLDISASDELQAALQAYRGTLIVVTHDRELIASLAGCKIVVVEGGKIAPSEQAEEYIAKFLGPGH